MYSRTLTDSPHLPQGLTKFAKDFVKSVSPLRDLEDVFFGGDGFAWMLQEVLKWLVNGLQPTY